MTPIAVPSTRIHEHEDGSSEQGPPKRSQRWLTAVIPILIGLAALPQPFKYPMQGLDQSYEIGLKLAAMRKLQFGSELVFTYGPYGFLESTFINRYLWLPAVAFALAAHVFLMAALVALAKRAGVRWHNYLLLLLLFPGMYLDLTDYKALLGATIFLFLSATDSSSAYRKIPIISASAFALALISLYKFNLLLVATAVVVAFGLMSFFRGKRPAGFLLAGFFLLFILVLWLAAGQSAANLPAYILTGFYTSDGYSDAMSLAGPRWQVFAALAAILSLTALPAAALIRRDSRPAIFLLISAPTLFGVFKHGFVRHDIHVVIFYTVAGVLFLATYFVLRASSGPADKWPAYYAIAFATLMAFLVHQEFWSSGYNVWDRHILGKIPNYKSAVALALDGSYGAEFVDDARRKIQMHYGLDPAITELIGDSTVDVFPWDISAAWAYGLNWQPRPVFQSYQAYTGELDNLNETFLRSNNSPENLLYAYSTIDGRYPLADEPATFRAILEGYRYVRKDQRFILLAKRGRTGDNKKKQVLSTVKSSLGKKIEIPAHKGPVYAAINLEYSGLGRALRFAYRPAYAWIQFELDDGTRSPPFRFIQKVGANGVYVSGYAGSLTELAAIFQGKPSRRIRNIRITVADKRQYKGDISVTFFTTR